MFVTHTFLSTRLERELRFFRSLSGGAQRLLLSTVLFELSAPMLHIFVNAFIYRQTGTFTAVAAYNVGYFCAIAIFFYVNSFLLERVRQSRLVSFGLVGQGIVISTLMYMSEISLVSSVFFGFLGGIPAALYWGNRHLLTSEVTTDQERTYFFGLEEVLATLAGILSPFVIGLFLHWTVMVRGLSLEQGYQVVSLVSILLLLASARSISSISTPLRSFSKHTLGKSSRVWNWVRFGEVCIGISNGLNTFIGALVVFLLLGSEQELGITQSVAALVTAASLYVVARKLKPSGRLLFLLVGLMVNLAFSLYFSVVFTALSAVIFIVAYELSIKFMWSVGHTPLLYYIIDAQDDGDSTDNYVYFVDREVFLNAGRVLGLGIFFYVLSMFEQATAVRVIVVVTAVLQFGVAVGDGRALQLQKTRR